MTHVSAPLQPPDAGEGLDSKPWHFDAVVAAIRENDAAAGELPRWGSQDVGLAANQAEHDRRYLLAAIDSLASQPPDAGEGLDVERLIDALRVVDEQIVTEHPEEAVQLQGIDVEAGRRDYAVALAREYAALSPVKEKEAAMTRSHPDPDPLHVDGDELWEPSPSPWLALIVGVAIGLVFGVVIATATAPRSAATATSAAGLVLTGTPSSGTPSRPSGASLFVPGGAPLPTQDPGELTSATASEEGIASYVGARFGPVYLALPQGPGHRVRICAAAHPSRCVTRVSTDAGPDLAMQRAGRVADVSYADFGRLCACHPPDLGLLHVTVEPVGRGVSVVGLPTPPATETGP